MELGTIHFLVANMRNGDAVSQHTFELVRILRQHSAAIHIFHNLPNGPLPDDILPHVQHADYASYKPSADLTILQYPVWFPLAERFRQAPGAALFWYHGVTPPSLWGARPGLAMIQNAVVRTELAWHAHLAAADSPFIGEELHNHSHYPCQRIRVVPLNIDVEKMAQKPSEETLAALRAQRGIEGKRILLYVGRVAGNKRIDLLIRAVAQLQRSNVTLLVVGDVVSSDAARILHPELEALAAQLGIKHQVIFTGRVAQVDAYFHLADILLLPSQHEGFGAPVAEAMAAGTPVIVSASGSLPWVIGVDEPDTPPAGLQFREENLDDLVTQITLLLDDPNLRNTLVAQGRLRARFFSKERFEANVLAIIEETMRTAKQERPPIEAANVPALAPFADVVIRDYHVRSGAPVVGPLIEWVRNNSTTHVKEAYLDHILERQVNYNRLVASEAATLQSELVTLRAEVNELRRQVASLQPELSTGNHTPNPDISNPDISNPDISNPETPNPETKERKP